MSKHLFSLFLSTSILLGIIQAGAAEKPYVILISFDGFRWDYANRGITPNLDKIRRKGVAALSLEPVFPSKTFPNHLSIVTGMYPENHGIIVNEFMDPFTMTEYSMYNDAAENDSKWYLGEAIWETAERQGITSACYFWPGSTLELKSRQPSYFHLYDHYRPYETRVEGVLNWLQLPPQERPHLITLYFHEVDSKGHDFGPESDELNQAVALVDGLLGTLMAGIGRLPLADSVNIIVVSDHGMNAISQERSINLESEILSGFTCRYNGNGPFQFIDPAPEKISAVYQKLKAAEKHFRVYLKEEMPDHFHYKHHPFISPILVLADPGWSVFSNASLANVKWSNSKGSHGYDNHYMDMHGIFFAIGPAFKQGYHTGTVRNIDIYPLICEIFRIIPRQNIDGKLENISYILKARQ